MNTDLKMKSAESLKAMALSLTVKDKKEASKKFKVHYNTILNYLRGEGSNVDLGLQLVDFFKGKMNAKISMVHKILAE